nr:MAG TPA: major capsid protein [Caudoviricetes sp.]
MVVWACQFLSTTFLPTTILLPFYRTKRTNANFF